MNPIIHFSKTWTH